jgi:YidC/Oxa1 family membrane protein insertase
MDSKKNLYLAFTLAIAVMIAWQYFVAGPQMKKEQARQAQITHYTKAPAAIGAPSAPGIYKSHTAPGHLSRAQALKQDGPRIAIDTPMVDGSLSLKGARLDDLRLKTYHETIDPKSPEITLLSPKGTEYPYYADFGWVGTADVPTDSTVWKRVSGNVIAPGKPVTLEWNNGHGLIFHRVISVDDRYMFTVKETVRNASNTKTTLYPYAAISRDGVPKEKSSMYLHVGFIGVAGGSEKDGDYDHFKDEGTPPIALSSTGGWVGITDKYWMAAVIPPQKEHFEGEYLGTTLAGDIKAYQANYRLGARVLEPGATISVTNRLFAGAKVVDTLRYYEHKHGVTGFDQAVDWGWFFFLTRPIFWVLDQFFQLVGNFGVAILLLTVLVKLIFFPLANVSYTSMSRMKKVQPEMERIKKQFSDDPAKQQQEIMALYRREKANPLLGCLPMLIQIPVFIALYKVLYITIEMRQAPFFGWIHDLSAPDPTSFINLFGLLPFNPHLFLPGFLAFLSIGIWPILYGMTQFVQTKMNPAPADPMQARMFTFMPLIFTFMFAQFPAGLVIYYTWNNLLSVTQQYVIMRRLGVKVHLFENLKIPALLRRVKPETSE